MLQNKQKHQLPTPRSGIDRRTFMERALASGLTVAAAATLWSDAAKASPKSGGTLRIGMADGATSDSWDPAVTNTRYMIHMNHVNRNMLTEINSENELGSGTGQVLGGLRTTRSTGPSNCSRASSSTAARPSARKTWSTTINYHRNPDTGSAVASLLAQIDDIKADGPNRVSHHAQVGQRRPALSHDRLSPLHPAV